MKLLHLRSRSLLAYLSLLAAPCAVQGQDSKNFDLAKTRVGGNIVYISSGAKNIAFQAIDDDRRTTFTFSNSDPRPTIVVELTGTAPVHRVSIVPGSEGGPIDIYLLDELPRDPTNLGDLKPIATMVDLMVGHEAAVDFEPRPVRFVVLQWKSKTPLPNGLAVAEISAFTKSAFAETAELLAAADPPPPDPISGPPVISNVSP